MSMRDVIRSSGWGPSRGMSRRMPVVPWQQHDEIQDDTMLLNNNVSGDNVHFNQEVNQFADALKRIAMKNKITGNIVNTSQKVKEVNRRPKARKSAADERQTKRSALADDVLDDLAEALRRVAIANNFHGNNINSAQKVEEYHDEDFKEVAQALQRLGFINNIAVNRRRFEISLANNYFEIFNVLGQQSQHVAKY